MKDELKREEWIFPKLQANMRNQVNIANINVQQGILFKLRSASITMQISIEKLKSGSSLTGDVPLFFKMRPGDWRKKKDEVLKHCFELMYQKSEKNVVVLWKPLDFNDWKFKDVADDIKRVIKDKKVVSYPSKQTEEEGILNVKDFVEKSNHILVTESHYFNGCEAANIIFLYGGYVGVRNCILRGVQNIICVRETYSDDVEIRGMKEDNRFL